MSNFLRNTMIKQAVGFATFKELPITIENVARFLPGPHADPELKGAGGTLLIEQADFELDATDLEPWQASKPAPVAAELPEGEKLVGTVAALPAPAPVKKLSRPERFALASDLAVQLEHQRVDLRVELETANRNELDALRERNEIAHAFAAGFGAPQTQEQLLREHIASENEYRRKVAAGEIPARRHYTGGPSAVDKFAAATRGGNPAWAGGGFRRGAYSPSQAARLRFQVPPKPPSQR